VDLKTILTFLQMENLNKRESFIISWGGGGPKTNGWLTLAVVIFTVNLFVVSRLLSSSYNKVSFCPFAKTNVRFF
jgi:hypothetical protein